MLPGILLALGGAAAGGLAYASLIERRWYTLRHVRIPALPADAGAGLRILHLSDLHLTPGQEHKQAFVRRCLQSSPDLVVVTGDFLGHADAIEPTIELFAEVAQGRHAIAVLGSNDRYGPTFKNPFGYLTGPSGRGPGPLIDSERLIKGLTAAGWEVLENRRTLISTTVGTVDIAGLDDPHIRRDRPGDIDWSEPEHPVALRLGVVHAPYLRALAVFERRGYDLALSGHTHGGQLRIPGIGALVDNCDLPLDQARGLSRHGDRMWLHVSAGIGTSTFAPFRFACRPEASVLEVVPAGGEVRGSD
ncbi:MAG TPA: metallophosphoesterase [Egibacteraceae bacterium]|nr:metallophosphoesterase [Egibacteraceae bacterium]